MGVAIYDSCANCRYVLFGESRCPRCHSTGIVPAARPTTPRVEQPSVPPPPTRVALDVGAEAQRLEREGVSRWQIAERLGVSFKTVRRWLEPGSGGRVPDVEVMTTVRDLHAAGRAGSEIAAELGVTHQQVSGWLRLLEGSGR